MPADLKQPGQLTSIWRVIVEIALIMFLLYSTLLMREFTHVNEDGKNLAFAIQNILTLANFVVAIISGLVGSLILRYLKKRI